MLRNNLLRTMPNEDGNIEVEYPDKATANRDTYFIPPGQYDPDTHTLAESEEWSPEDYEPEAQQEEEPAPEPSDALKEKVGTRQANRLAESGLDTVEKAAGYAGDLTELPGVGDSTAKAFSDDE